MLVLDPAPGRADEVHLLVYNAEDDATFLEMLEDATGFTIHLSGRFNYSDFNLSSTVVSAVRDFCRDDNTGVYFALDAKKATRFVGPVRCSSGTREQAVKDAKATEVAWESTISQMPAGVRLMGYARVGALLNMAYSQARGGCVNQQPLDPFLPQPVRLGLSQASRELVAYGFTYCSTLDGEPVAPFADYVIVTSGLDNAFAGNIMALLRQRPGLALRAARAAVSNAMQNPIEFRYESFAGDWTTSCEIKGRLRAGSVFGQVDVTCNAAGSSDSVSYATELGNRPARAGFVRLPHAGSKDVKDGLLLIGFEKQASKLDICVATPAAKPHVGGRPREPAGASSFQIRITRVPANVTNGGAPWTPIGMHNIAGRDGCHFWFESPRRKISLIRRAGCQFLSVPSIGASVFQTRCACEDALDDFRQGRWELQ